MDGLRAFAVVAVIAAHAHVPWFHGGGVGVEVFFGISGFLITYLLIQEQKKNGRIALGLFWLRRLVRLMPALILLLVCINGFAIVIAPFTSNDYLNQSVIATPSVLFYFANWMVVATNSAFLGWFGPLWSLSVEEQFYFVWPIVVLLCFRFKHSLRVIGTAAAVIATGATINRFVIFDGTNLYRTFGTDFRVDMLLAGVLLAVGLHAGGAPVIRRVSKVLAGPAALFLLVICVIVPDFPSADSPDGARLYYTLGLPFVALATVSVIGYLVTHQSGRVVRVLSWRPLEYTGQISYGMYLWHYPVVELLRAAVSNTTLIFVLCMLGTYIAATLSWVLVEQPLQRRFHQRLKPRATLVAT
ncbi:acyltransferase family protein [Plantibacter sp. VKM Ac-2880]|uniref:acyltransferase family protein n=1 Tax=Plantibacter sp. VKM Ac-2880 TaxID=2783827 RepID=UPI00351C3A0D